MRVHKHYAVRKGLTVANENNIIITKGREIVNEKEKNSKRENCFNVVL